MREKKFFNNLFVLAFCDFDLAKKQTSSKMAIIFTILVLFGYLFGFVFSCLSLACGLYWCAELVEEYSQMTKKVITYTIYTILAIHVLLYLEGGMPLIRILISIGCLGLNSLMLPSFPAIELDSVVFLLSCVMVIANHFMWFFYFTDRKSSFVSNTRIDYYSFAEIASFFAICVWLVPFMFFISLSANEFTLPAFGAPSHDSNSIDASLPGSRRASQEGNRINTDQDFNPAGKRKKGNLIKQMLDYVLRRDDANSSFLGSSNPRKVY
jgi:hypothetical protein